MATERKKLKRPEEYGIGETSDWNIVTFAEEELPAYMEKMRELGLKARTRLETEIAVLDEPCGD